MAVRKSKYAHIVDKLPRLPGVEPERRDVIDQVKKEILAPLDDDGELDTTGVTYALASAALDTCEARIKYIIQMEKRSTAGRPYAAEFARAYAELRSIRERIDSWSADVGVLLEAYHWLMVDQMETEGISSLRLANGQPITVYLEPYAQVVDKEKFRLWCVQQGLERELALPWRTRDSLTKQRLLAGDPEPDGITCYAKTKVRLGSE